MTEQAKKLDQALLEGLARRGFRLDFGDDGAGWQFKYLTRGGGYYFNVGCSDLIVKGEVDLIQFPDIAEFVADGARLRNGNVLKSSRAAASARPCSEYLPSYPKPGSQ